MERDAMILAKLAADEAMFFNPMAVWEAKLIRDRYLALSLAGQPSRTSEEG